MNYPLEMKQISKTFKQGRTEIQALKSLDFHVQPGEFVSIIGPSGSGKSTFLTIAGILQEPSNGTLLVDGQDVSQLSDKQKSELRFGKIGFILQSSNLIPFLTVKEQFQLLDRYIKEKTNKEKINNLLTSLGIEELANQYPNDLSGGERQRVAIAKALYHHPSVILADEPTASLDSERAFEVVELLKEQAHQTKAAIIMVTHDKRLIPYSDRVFEMEDGLMKERPSK
ncbi:ABC transporter ATP-binding protein [Atopobacter phocae]|uniref:ABC transporter ATP-binding protein n=1 Tax=Atopobacter phocae TaxID=136492 RepID=UPI000470AF03|nr:ABC transporter ATP-binding protein [Atopobacter phocae]